MDETMADRSGTEQRLQMTNPNTAEVLRELSRHGYLPDAESIESSSRMFRLRHPAGPDLLLRHDGALELPLGQPLRNPAAAAATGKSKKIFWGRGLMVLFLLSVLTLFGLALMIAVTGIT